MSRTLRRIPLLLATTALLAAGCGGDDSNSGSSGGSDEKRLSQAEFTAEGKRICREGAEEAQEVVRKELAKPEVKKLSETEQKLAAFRAGRDSTEKTMQEIEDLPAPKSAEPHVRTMVDGVRETMDLIDEIAEKPDAARQSEIATRIAELAASTRNAATKAGLSECLPENTP